MKPLRHHVPTLVVALIAALGVGAVLFAWRLPPFAGDEIRTENAYVRGNVTTISPQIAGYVAAVPVVDYQAVKKGDVLATLDDRAERQDLARAEAGLAGAEAALRSNAQNIRSAEAGLTAKRAAVGAAEVAVETAKTDFDRQNKLKAKGFASGATADDSALALRRAEAALTEAQSEVDVAREAVAAAKIDADALKADLADAQAAVELAKIELDHAVIRAPADGRLGRIGVKPGQYVAVGAALMSHVAPQVWIIANVRERELADMAVGQPVRFTVDALHDRGFTGRIERFSPATASEFSVLSTSTATGNFTKIAQRLPVRIAIDPGQAEGERLAPGMSVVLHAPRAG